VGWYTLLSFRALAEIAALKAEVAGGRNPKDAKVMLAKEITTRFHSARRPTRPSRTFANRSKGGVPDDIPRCSCRARRWALAALLKQANLAPSSSEANRLIDGGGVRVDGGVVRQGPQAGGGQLRGAGGQAQVCARGARWANFGVKMASSACLVKRLQLLN
jgi:tyrosyl-tRNA synthetase